MLVEERFVHFLHGLGMHRGQSRGRHAPVRHFDHERAHEIFQASTINALLEGVYDGEMTIAELGQHGDFGLGTFNGLDGEMIAFDGDFFQIRGDGVALPAAGELKTPFAVVQYFEAEQVHTIASETTFQELQQLLAATHHSHNFFYAIRVDADFSYVRTRSVPRQQPPYPPLVDVAKNQPVFEFQDVSGTLVGFRFPDFAAGFNVPGYHLHFLTQDRLAGGHILDLRLRQGQVQVELTADFHVELPQTEDFGDADLAKDQRDAVGKVESGE